MTGLTKKAKPVSLKRDLTKEVDVQDTLRKRVLSLNGLFVKIMAASLIGFPDALCLFPGGRLVLVELKRPKGGVVSGGQSTLSRVLLAMGFDVRLITTMEDAHAFGI